jgi:hypothetical protein
MWVRSGNENIQKSRLDDSRTNSLLATQQCGPAVAMKCPEAATWVP